MYENTGARAHVMAAELIDAGVDVAGVYQRLYEEMPFDGGHELNETVLKQLAVADA